MENIIENCDDIINNLLKTFNDLSPYDYDNERILVRVKLAETILEAQKVKLKIVELTE